MDRYFIERSGQRHWVIKRSSASGCSSEIVETASTLTKARGICKRLNRELDRKSLAPIEQILGRVLG